MPNFIKDDTIERVDLETFNKLLNIANDRTRILVIDNEEKVRKLRSDKRFHFSDFSILLIELKRFDLITKYGNKQFKPQRFRLLQPSSNQSDEFNGGLAYRILQKSCSKYGERIPSIKDNRLLHKFCKWVEKGTGLDRQDTYLLSASPLIDYNKKFDGKTIQGVWSYDLNSAYSSICCQEGIPDVTKARYYTVVKEGEIGFEDDSHLTLVHQGEVADVVMPVVKNKGLTEFCQHWFKVKKESPKGSRERDKAKFYLNASIGMFQRHNPFVRAYIVNRCTEKIKKVLNNNSILWNTDGFYSTERRTDLDIGNDIGQFKEEYIEIFRLKGCTYQKNEEVPVWRGVEKAFFKEFEKANGRAFILNQDELPTTVKTYVLDKQTMQIKEKQNGKN